MYRGDKPITQGSEDRLGRKLFCSELAKSILNLSSTDTFTIGLYGKWGVGKTSIIHLTIQELKKLSCSMAEDRVPVIIQFNPWNYTDSTQLIYQFFNTLSNSLKIQKHDRNLGDIGTTIQEYSDALEFAECIPIIGKYAKVLRLIGLLSGNTLKSLDGRRKKNIEEVRKDICKKLEEQKRKIIIIIDDIDRLSNDQIKMIFQLVNAVASFPNVIYLLSFDREVVCRAISTIQDCDGNEYLEKIIQIPFEIPTAPIQKINKVFFTELDSILAANSIKEFDENRWSSCFWSIIQPNLNSIRDVKRLLNCFCMKFNFSYKELDWIDLLSITTLQTFFPQIYKWIIANKESLTGGLDPYVGISMTDQSKNKTQQTAVFENIVPGKAEYVLDCLSLLFPQYGRQVGDHYVYMDSAALTAKHRIACVDRFDFFFSLSIDEIPIGAEVLNEIIQDYNEQQIKETYDRIIKEGKLYEYLTHLKGILSSIPKTRIALISRTLFLVIGLDSDSYNKGFTYRSNDTLAGECIFALLRSVSLEERSEIIKTGLLDMDFYNLAGISTIINREELHHGRLAAQAAQLQAQILRIDDLLEIERIFLTQIKKIVTTHSLLDLQKMHMPAYLWECYDALGYREYILKELHSDKNKCKYVASNAEQWISLTEENSFGWTFSGIMGEKYLSVDDSRKAIEAYRKTGEFQDLPSSLKEKVAAFMLYTSAGIENDSISQKKAQRLLTIWKAGGNIEDIDWNDF